MSLPKPLYEALPLLYVIAGIVCISSLESLTSFISGLLFAIAGIAILFMRRNFRQQLSMNSIE